MEKILNVWIMNDSGICLFNQAKSSTLQDENLFTGFLSSIQVFLKSIGEEKIKSLAMGEHKFTFCNLEEPNLIIVVKSERNIKGRFIARKIKDIREKFLKKYGQLLHKYQEHSLLLDLRIFDDFNEDLSDILTNKIESNMSAWIKVV